MSVPFATMERPGVGADANETLSHTQDWHHALGEWSELLGTEHVQLAAPALERYARCTLPQGNRPRAILRPSSTSDVSRIVQIASLYRLPLYPISRGKNWGYGDACPVTEGQVIVDLSRMDRIVEVDPTLAYAVIEPGVTQGQMAAYLQDKGFRLWLDVTGAGPEASIVGNTLERGFGHTPYGDHFAHSCGMEVVLADGRVINTGFGAFPGAKAARVHPWGIGPWLDGLFTQSNFGVVTQLGIWLLPEPEVCQGFALSAHKVEDLARIVDALRELRLQDVVRSTVHVANDLRVLSSRMNYPWKRAGGKTPLPKSLHEKLRTEAGLGAWNVLGALYGTRETVAAAGKIVRRRLRSVGRVVFFDGWKLKQAERLSRWLGSVGVNCRWQKAIPSVRSGYDLLRGVPSSEHLRGAMWRSKMASNGNINPAASGLIWLAPVLPMTGDACTKVMALIEPELARFGFEPLVTLSAVSARSLCCVLSICYDRSDEAETSRAEACYDTLLEILLEHGYIPYRCGIQSMRRISQRQGPIMDVLRQLKFALDPYHVLAPGRYECLDLSVQAEAHVPLL